MRYVIGVSRHKKSRPDQVLSGIYGCSSGGYGQIVTPDGLTSSKECGNIISVPVFDSPSNAAAFCRKLARDFRRADVEFSFWMRSGYIRHFYLKKADTKEFPFRLSNVLYVSDIKVIDEVPGRFKTLPVAYYELSLK